MHEIWCPNYSRCTVDVEFFGLLNSYSSFTFQPFMQISRWTVSSETMVEWRIFRWIEEGTSGASLINKPEVHADVAPYRTSPLPSRPLQVVCESNVTIKHCMLRKWPSIIGRRHKWHWANKITQKSFPKFYYTIPFVGNLHSLMLWILRRCGNHLVGCSHVFYSKLYGWHK